MLYIAFGLARKMRWGERYDWRPPLGGTVTMVEECGDIGEGVGRIWKRKVMGRE